ncbi:MAG TPA: hypothetical protein PLM79_09145 [Syntrophobacteraceae bacterium]|nr:hypothetical protein [Syntrophobacteraceae bacterium]
MGGYRFDDRGILYLDTLHPGVTVEKIRENCGFDLNVTRVKGETPAPTYRELFVLREFVDPELIFLPPKMDYLPVIRSFPFMKHFPPAAGPKAVWALHQIPPSPVSMTSYSPNG